MRNIEQQLLSGAYRVQTAFCESMLLRDVVPRCILWFRLHRLSTAVYVLYTRTALLARARG